MGTRVLLPVFSTRDAFCSIRALRQYVSESSSAVHSYRRCGFRFPRAIAVWCVTLHLLFQEDLLLSNFNRESIPFVHTPMHTPAVKPEHLVYLWLFCFLEPLPCSAAGPGPHAQIPFPVMSRSWCCHDFQCKRASLTKHIPAKGQIHTFTPPLKHLRVTLYPLLVCMCSSVYHCVKSSTVLETF